MVQRISIISYAPERNRQGFDLASICSERGNTVRLFQLSNRTERERISDRLDVKRIRLVSPKVLPRGRGLLTMAKFILSSVCTPADIVVGINLPGLQVGSLVSRLNNARLIYYSLEMCDGRKREIERQLLKKRCYAIIGVEENRLHIVLDSVNGTIPTFVIHNVPRKGFALPTKGRLRYYLVQKYGVRPDQKIVLLHGSYQQYLCIEAILESMKQWSAEVLLGLMLTDAVPHHIQAKITEHKHRAFLVPPVSHTELYKWMADADLGLLPYDGCQSNAVRFCSPQKLFDYMACGIPILGSKRPIIQKVLSTYQVGLLADFSNPIAISDGINAMLGLPREKWYFMKQQARECYEGKYNYDDQAKELIEFIGSIAER